MYLVAIVGDLGSGKSCFMTSCLAADAKKGRPVTANYSLYFPPEYTVYKRTPMEIVGEAKEGKLKGHSVGIDEMGVAADSYDFFEEQPQEIAAMGDQLRKDRAMMYFTVPRLMRVTKRIRDMVGAFFICEDVDRHLNPGPDHRETCMGISHIVQLDQDLSYVRDFYFDMKPWFSFYNTDEKQPRAKRVRHE